MRRSALLAVLAWMLGENVLADEMNLRLSLLGVTREASDGLSMRTACGAPLGQWLTDGLYAGGRVPYHFGLPLGEERGRRNLEFLESIGAAVTLERRSLRLVQGQPTEVCYRDENMRVGTCFRFVFQGLDGSDRVRIAARVLRFDLRGASLHQETISLMQGGSVGMDGVVDLQSLPVQMPAGPWLQSCLRRSPSNSKLAL